MSDPRRAQHEIVDDDVFDEDPDELEDEMNCSLMPDGQCLQAGTEYCDLKCPYRD